MRIDINDKWVLQNRDRCYVLGKRNVVMSGENKGNEIISDDSFYSDIKSALSRIPERMVMKESEAGSIKELIGEIKKYQELIVEMLR